MGGFLSAEGVVAVSRLALPDLDKDKPVPVAPVKSVFGEDRRVDEAARDAKRRASEARWPAAGTAETGALARTGKAVEVGGLPVEVAAPGAGAKAPGGAQIQVLDRAVSEKLGVPGVLLAVRGTDAAAGGDAKSGDAKKADDPEAGAPKPAEDKTPTKVKLTLDYSGFADAFGADWASRLSLAQLPACALQDPGKAGCGSGTALKTANDTDDKKLTAEVALPASGAQAGNGDPVTRTKRSASGYAAAPGVTLLAASAAPQGGGGDFKATPLTPSGHWAAGTSSGGFSWQYELQTPEVPGGLEPELALGYSSQSLDGRTAATNNQTNWVGDGWSLTENYIERRYASCNDDMKSPDGKAGNNKAKNGEQCWRSDNATMSLNGQSHELVKDDKSGDWKLKDDDGTRIERLTDTARGNGDADGEYWRITTTDGVKYHFGYNRLPGWSQGRAETNSTWTVPVYGNHAGEPGNKAAFADSWQQQAWRWNLDYVVDPNANATAYHYAAETNRYARDFNLTTGKGTPTAYTRGGHLTRIEYGLRADNLFGANAAAAKVEFEVAERCLPDSGFDCAPAKMTEANAKRWPDVPVDQHCATGDCKKNMAPTFWTTKRLAKITTQALVGSGYQNVDSWDLRHQFPDPGDGSTPALWLAGITRTGHTGDKPEKLPEITFQGQQLANRVDTTGDGIPPLVRYRVFRIDTETGGSVGVTYSAPDCKPGDLPAEASNDRRCYPVYWMSADSPAADFKPKKDWFHKYVATEVLENDHVGGAPAQQTRYSYLGGAAWTKSEDEFTQPEYRTYSEFRGYGEVRTLVGTGKDGRQLDSRTRYFRGIQGAEVADFEGIKTADHPAHAGMERGEALYNGTETVSEESAVPWRSAPTATRARPGLPALTAEQTGVQSESERSPAAGGTWQRTKTDRTFDAYGMVATVTDHGDLAKTGDESCTTTSYTRSAANVAANMIELETGEKTVTGTCAAPGTELISETRSTYDAKGNTLTEEENDGKGTGLITVARSTYDAHGRPLTVTDAADAKMTTVYTPATGASPTKAVVTNPLGHALTTEYDPRRGHPTAEIDANDKRTDVGYDGLGRLTAVWEPGRAKATYPTSPSASYAYTISRTQAPVVSETTLKNDGRTETSYTIYDGLLRERQTQEASASGVGRVIEEVLYDSRGLEWKVFDGYYATGGPEGKLVAGDDTKAPAALRTVYDGAGRPTDAIAMKFGDETRRTVTQYDGNRTTVLPPKGGTARTTVTDAVGRTVEVVEYTSQDRTTSQSIKYAYDKRGSLVQITDPAGNQRKFGYDARGREVRSEDPDQGVATTTYDAMDRPVTTTDGRGVSLTSTYDVLGRKTALKEGAKTLAEWSYDSVAKGEMSEARRLIGANVYTQKITGYTDDYQPKGMDVVVPAAEGGLAGTYKWGFAYNQYTGMLGTITQPAIGDLPAERVVTRYDAQDEVQGLTAGGRILVNSAQYDAFGRVMRTEYNDNNTRRLYRSWAYDEHTGELLRATTDRSMAPQRVDDTHYSYDLAGNVTRITTATGQDQQKSTDTQCFTTDALQRMTQAWTSKDDCAGAPSKEKVGGPQPYWLSYSYDALGNRTQETRHDVGGDTAKNTVRTYGYAKEGGLKPAALTSVETKTGTVAGPKDTFTYDASGNTVTRKAEGREQKLNWDAENQLASVEEAGGPTTSYTYDADGNRLIRKDGQGSTLYLPGGNELTLGTDGKKAGTRYYELDGDPVAARTGGEIQFLFADHHGTATAAIDATTQDVTHRALAPFGEDRAEVSAGVAVAGGAAVAGSAAAIAAAVKKWPGDRGFVNGARDGTGLTQLGARAYDPKLGRFLSVDPMIDRGESQRMNAYAYANNNPVTFSDPDGLFFGKVKNFVKKTTKKVTKTVKKVAKKVVKATKKVVATVKKVVKKVAAKVKKVVKKVAKATKKVVKRTVKAVKKYVKKKTAAVTKKVKSKGNSLKQKMSKGWNKVKAGGSKAWGGLKSGVSKGWNAITSTRSADILGKVSTFTGAVAGVLAVTGAGGPAAAIFGAISLGTGAASAGIYAGREGFGSQNFKNAAVGVGLGVVGGGFGKLAGRGAANLGIRGSRFIGGGLKATLPVNSAGKLTKTGMYMSLKYDAMPTAVGAVTTDWRNW
ncbi:RHS repeat domain-containing protein [Streptomyces sp. NPDC050504]|uniref:RHS repeat domain-containing protein n=1 Tax=Streptomyces sp. NPDC050504 TaxID=3365618 RepID=UPI0037BA49A3